MKESLIKLFMESVTSYPPQNNSYSLLWKEYIYIHILPTWKKWNLDNQWLLSSCKCSCILPISFCNVNVSLWLPLNTAYMREKKKETFLLEQTYLFNWLLFFGHVRRPGTEPLTQQWQGQPVTPNWLSFIKITKTWMLTKRICKQHTHILILLVSSNSTHLCTLHFQ